MFVSQHAGDVKQEYKSAAKEQRGTLFARFLEVIDELGLFHVPMITPTSIIGESCLLQSKRGEVVYDPARVLSSGLIERLRDICNDIVDVLNAYGDTHQVRANSGFRQFFLIQLTVRGRSRMTGQ